MSQITQEEKEEVIKKLAEKGVKGVCPMCGNNNFVVADAYFSNTLQPQLGTTSLGGPSIPTIPIICSKCGFVSQHALGMLGLLPKEEEKNGKE